MAHVAALEGGKPPNVSGFGGTRSSFSYLNILQQWLFGSIWIYFPHIGSIFPR